MCFHWVVLRWAEKRLKSICREKLEEKKENEVEGPHCVVLCKLYWKVREYLVFDLQCSGLCNVQFQRCAMCDIESLKTV